MGTIWRTWNEISLIKRILVFLVIGVILALACPGIEWISMLGSTIFVGALKAIAPLLVLFLVSSAMANAKANKNMGTVIALYVCGTLIAALVSVIVSMAFPVELQLQTDTSGETPPSGIAEVLNNVIASIFMNPVDALVQAKYLAILFWALLLGIALRATVPTTRKVFTDMAAAINQIVRWVISFAPIGIMGLVYNAVSTSGMSIFITYGQLIVILVGVMLIVALVTNPLLVWLNIHQNPYPLVFTTLKDSGLYAFFTRSSAANIPINMELCNRLGLNKDLYSVSIPLGATINMSGAAVTISVMSMMAAHTLGITVDPVTAVILCVLAAVSACGASGVPSGSLLLIPVACSLFGIGNDVAMQVAAVGFVIAVIQDSCETALNSSSDVLFAATAEYRDWRKQGKPIVIPKHPVGANSGAIVKDDISTGKETEAQAEAEEAAASGEKKD